MKAAGRAGPTTTYQPGPLIDDDEALDAAIAALRLVDGAVIDVMLAHGGRPPLRRREAGFAALASIVVSQQLSTASADAIFARLRAHVTPLDAAGLLAADDKSLRACGLSAGKVATLRTIALAVADGTLALEHLASLPAEEAHDRLVALKGIGPWTADIFLLSCLGHPDAWPAGDIALQEAARLVLGLETRPNARGLEALGERWRPHRGVAARLLWAYYRVAKGREGLSLGSLDAHAETRESPAIPIEGNNV